MNHSDTNHISVARQHLLDQLAALRQATPATLKDELARARGISELAQALTNTARVEVEYLVATSQTHAPFLESQAQADDPLPQGITGITRHRIRG